MEFFSSFHFHFCYFFLFQFFSFIFFFSFAFYQERLVFLYTSVAFFFVLILQKLGVRRIIMKTMGNYKFSSIDFLEMPQKCSKNEFFKKKTQEVHKRESTLNGCNVYTKFRGEFINHKHKKRSWVLHVFIRVLHAWYFMRWWNFQKKNGLLFSLRLDLFLYSDYLPFDLSVCLIFTANFRGM